VSATLPTLDAPPVSRPEHHRRSAMEWMDRFAGSDPGLNRFRMALQCVLGVAAAIGGGWLFAHFTHALQLEGKAAAAVSAVTVAVHTWANRHPDMAGRLAGVDSSTAPSTHLGAC
jgi:hypothetical protein